MKTEKRLVAEYNGLVDEYNRTLENTKALRGMRADNYKVRQESEAALIKNRCDRESYGVTYLEGDTYLESLSKTTEEYHKIAPLFDQNNCP